MEGFVYALWGAVVLAVATAVVYQYGDDDCDNNNPEVTVSVKHSETICPSDPITVRCVVNTTLSQQTTPFLLWKCTESSGQNVVLCEPILNFDCDFGRVENVTGSCLCDNKSLIVSEATFTATSTSARTLICSDGSTEEKVSITAKALHTPVLTYTEISGGNKIRNVTIEWTTPDSTKKDIYYLLSVKNVTTRTTWTTELPHFNLNLTVGTQYTAEVFSQRCGGNLKSNVSDLDIFLKEYPTSGVNPRQTSSALAPKQSGSSVSGIVGGTVASIVLSIAVGVVSVILVYLAITRYLTCGKLSVDGVKEYAGENISEKERSSIMKVEEDESREKGGVGGLCIDGNKKYYSCCEKNRNKTEERYTLHVWKPDGDYILGGFKHIRGIAKDNENCFYVVDSLNKRVLKFNSNWTLLRRTSHNSTQNGMVLNGPFGIYVNEKYVFVCARRNSKICIFDHELNLCYRIKHRNIESGPIDITFFEGKFFVVIKNAIVVFEIDFESKNYKVVKITKFYNDHKPEPFNAELELRGITASDQYLYVTETSGRLLCLLYHDHKLIYISSIPNCSPVVVVHNAGSIYYSRRTSEGKFALASVTHDNNNEMTTKDILII